MNELTIYIWIRPPSIINDLIPLFLSLLCLFVRYNLSLIAIGEAAVSGTAEYTQLAIFYSLIYGIIFLILGLLNVGFLLENILSRPALSGFTQGAAILIAFSQAKNILGIHVKIIYTVDNITYEILRHISHTNGYSVTIGVISVIVILIMKKVKKSFPTVILILMVGTLISWLIDAPAPDVSTSQYQQQSCVHIFIYLYIYTSFSSSFSPSLSLANHYLDTASY